MSKLLKLDFRYAKSLDLEKNQVAVLQAQEILEQKSGVGSEMLGWLDLPAQTAPILLEQIEAAAAHIQKTDALVVVGIGGSYLGTRAILDALSSPSSPTFLTREIDKQSLPLYFAGYNVDANHHHRLLQCLQNKRYAVNVISKSGTTFEPALAFRLLWNDLQQRFAASELKDLIFVTTDPQKGKLRKLVNHYGLHAFDIPPNVGGRFSVLSPVGLVPLAVANIKIRKLLEGAIAMREELKTMNFAANPALQYAAYRYTAYQSGKKIEIMGTYQTDLLYTIQWWQQLFGESEGKEGRGIFPACVNLTTDLHSLGQWMQEGERTFFETILDVEKVIDLYIPQLANDIDGLNYLAKKDIHTVNRSAMEATLQAHADANVPCLQIKLQDLDETKIGALLYFFEYACAIYCYLLKVNPFDQPGVEAYKKNMFYLLGKV